MSLGPLMIDLLGTSVTPEERELMRHPLVGGVVLFTRNYGDPEQLTQLVAAIHAERRPPKEILNRDTGRSEHVDFGHVGDILQIDSRLLTVLLNEGYLPVISSLGADAEGKVFNINADTIAAEIAIQLEAEKLVLLSDVDGIYLQAGEPQTKLSRLTADEADALIKKGTATGGMIPKLQNIVDLLRRGVKSAHIINGTSRNALLAEVFTDEGTGTMIAA